MQEKPLIVQSDASLMLDTHSPLFEEARNAIAVFTELEKSPEHFHIYRITNLSVWNAAACGTLLSHIEETLNHYSRFLPLPTNVIAQVTETYQRYGKMKLIKANDETLQLIAPNLKDHILLKQLISTRKVGHYFKKIDDSTYQLNDPLMRGTIKQEFIKMGWPITDLAPLKEGAPLNMNLKPETSVRSYQQMAVDAFIGHNQLGSGFGVVVLPCGSGKTMVGMATMAKLKNETLILAANISAARQWMAEILDKTDLDPSLIGEYSGEHKDVKPVTVATYQILIWRADKASPFEHFKIFAERQWGLIIYDEAHLLPAPVFRVTAEIQSVKRLGLTATLVREDGAETDVFSLIGPKRFDAPWQELEKAGWIAKAYCIEVKINLSEDDQYVYAVSPSRSRLRLAAENSRKVEFALKLAKKHYGQNILVIGQYLAQLEELAKAFNAPLITGKTKNSERELIYNQFRQGDIKILVVSKVANFSIDLPDASVAIQVSGTFGSRQEEAQRLGRILRPKLCDSYFYSLVSRFTDEETFSANRQKFLAEQGYRYSFLLEDDIA